MMSRSEEASVQRRRLRLSVNWSDCAWAGLLTLLAILAYWPLLRNGLVWNDGQFVSDRLAHQTSFWTQLDATPQYQPVTFTLLAMEHLLWGLSPLGYHIVNLLLHALAAVLVWHVLRRL